MDTTDILSLFIGAIIGWAIEHYYSAKSNRDQAKHIAALRQDNAILRRLSEINLTVLEESGALDPIRDENNNIIGRNATAHAKLQAISVVQAKATVTPQDPSSTNTDSQT